MKWTTRFIRFTGWIPLKIRLDHNSTYYRSLSKNSDVKPRISHCDSQNLQYKMHPEFWPSHRRIFKMSLYYKTRLILETRRYQDLGGGRGSDVSFGGHHEHSGKTTTGSALGGAVFDWAQLHVLSYLVAQTLVCLVHNMNRFQLYFGVLPFWPTLLLVNNIFVGLCLNYIPSVEIILFLLADIILEHGIVLGC